MNLIISDYCLTVAMPSPDATSVGAGSPRTGGGRAGNPRQRGGGTAKATTATRAGGTSSGGMWRYYTDDAPGVKVGPVPVMVMSLLFIACVFMLHIWGKYNRA